ncbi:hypothetical protein AB834_05460 [PVC group bacterium (ex Bugula neritina AB1)]|nr:hypothetical protein AB834_05460 [PVC group bacterium (ex Bugula neritina AB1)]
MYFFMYLSYICNFISFFMLAIVATQISLPFLSFLFYFDQFSLGLLSIIVYLFTQTLIIFFFTGMGVNIRDYTKEKQLSDELYQKTKKHKFLLFGPLLLNMGLMIAVFILGGAVQTKGFPAWIQGILFWLALLHYFSILKKEHLCFSETVDIVLEMTKEEREKDIAKC